MGRGLLSILVGIFMIVGGLTDTLVLKGTDSSLALVPFGAIVLLLGIVRIANASRESEATAELEPGPARELARFEALLHGGRIELMLSSFRVADLLPPGEPDRRLATARVAQALVHTTDFVAALAKHAPEARRVASGLVALEEQHARDAATGRLTRTNAYQELATRIEADLEALRVAMLRSVQGGLVAKSSTQTQQTPLAQRPDDAAKAAQHREKAEAHATAGNLDDACYELERLVALDPSDDAAKARLVELGRRRDVENLRKWAVRHTASGKTAEAIDSYERLLRIEPSDEKAGAELERLKAGGS